MVLGLDVDDYDDKHGGETMRRLADEWGLLPATVRSTSMLTARPALGLRPAARA